MRRMKEASKYQAGMAFYAQMPDAFNLVLNSDHPLIKGVLDGEKQECGSQLSPVDSEIKGLEARLAVLHQSQSAKKPEEITQEEKDDIKHIGGIGIGGGTLQGLSRLLLKTDDIKQVAALAEEGDLSHINVLIKDICANPLQGLP